MFDRLRMHHDDGDLMGPGMDLALSLSGILMIVVAVTVAQLWFTSLRETPTPDEEDSLRLTTQMQVKLDDANERLSLMRAEAASQSNKMEEAYGRIGTLSELNQSLQKLLNLKTRDAADITARLRGVETQLTLSTREALDLKDQLMLTNSQLLELRALLREKTAEAALRSAERDREIQRANAIKSLLEQERGEKEEAEENVKRATERIILLFDEVQAVQRRLNDKPPLIIISDAKFSTFEQASADISPALSNYLRTMVPDLRRLRDQYGAEVIEIVGHTDEVRLARRRRCNLDEDLLDTANSRRSAGLLGPCDNVGLGMARAAAVINELRSFGLESEFTFLPLSGGQAIDTDGTLAKGEQVATPNPARRRIEIRLRRRGE